MTDLFDVVHAQRACRSFAPTPVSDDELGRLLDAATYAPSAENRQPWVFVVVRDDELRDGLHDLTARAWAWHDALRIMYVNSFRLLGAEAA